MPSILIVLLLIRSQCPAQEAPTLSTISRETAKDLSLVLVNQFQVAMTKLPKCPCMILTGTNEMFSKLAFIEVSSLNGKIERYAPEAYFRAVNALHCGKKPMHVSMKFIYRPMSASKAIVSYAPGSFSVTYPINQLFIGVQSKNGNVYKDVTIKMVHVGFIAVEHGVLQARITGITVEEKAKRPNDYTILINKP